MRVFILAAAFAASALPAVTFAQQPAAPAPAPAAGAAKFSTATSTIGALMADAAAKAVLDKHLPQLAQAGDQVPKEVTLKQIQEQAPQFLTPELLAAIDADLAKIK